MRKVQKEGVQSNTKKKKKLKAYRDRLTIFLYPYRSPYLNLRFPNRNSKSRMLPEEYEVSFD